MKKILYLTQRFRPSFEATSKEVALLASNFQGKIHDLHLDGFARFKFNQKLFSYHFVYYATGIIPLYLFSRNKLLHLYTSLCDRPYLPFFSSKNVIITSANFFSKDRIAAKKKHLLKVSKIVVQSELQKKELLDAGINTEKIEVIYPPVDVERFSYNPSTTKDFTILNASCPGKVRDLQKRGIYFLFDADSSLQGTKIKLLWRGGQFPLLMKKQKVAALKNCVIENKIHTDMNFQYARVHATIIPYLKLDENLKTMPTSAIESLAAGKPVLTSSQTGIAEIVAKERCGVVFEPSQEELLKAIEDLKRNYTRYQKNCRRTAEKYFSKNNFIKKHKELYQSIT